MFKVWRVAEVVTVAIAAVATMTWSGGVAAATTVHVQTHPQHVSGTVASVNGSGSCGTAGTSGGFVVTSASTTYTVDVGANSTTFKEKGVTTPSFAIVCPGDKVKTVGTVSPDHNVSNTDTIVIVPPK